MAIYYLNFWWRKICQKISNRFLEKYKEQIFKKIRFLLQSGIIIVQILSVVPDLFWMLITVPKKTLKKIFIPFFLFSLFQQKKFKKALKKKFSLKNFPLKRNFSGLFIAFQVRTKKRYHTKSDKIWERRKKKKRKLRFPNFFLGFSGFINGPDFQSFQFRTLFAILRNMQINAKYDLKTDELEF